MAERYKVCFVTDGGQHEVHTTTPPDVVAFPVVAGRRWVSYGPYGDRVRQQLYHLAFRYSPRRRPPRKTNTPRPNVILTRPWSSMFHLSIAASTQLLSNATRLSETDCIAHNTRELSRIVPNSNFTRRSRYSSRVGEAATRPISYRATASFVRPELVNGPDCRNATRWEASLLYSTSLSEISATTDSPEQPPRTATADRERSIRRWRRSLSLGTSPPPATTARIRLAISAGANSDFLDVGIDEHLLQPPILQ